MRVAILQANVGGIDLRHEHVAQDLPPGTSVEFVYLDGPGGADPRMRAKAPKMLGWEWAPAADVIIWLDASFRIRTSDFVRWILERLGEADACFMRHPDRKTILEEAAFMSDRIVNGDPYLTERYAAEPYIEQITHYLNDPEFNHASPLIAAGCFAYRPTESVKQMLRAWLAECVHWTCQDQLSLPYVLAKHGIATVWFDSGPWDCPHLEHVPHGNAATPPVKPRAKWTGPTPLVLSSATDIRIDWAIACIESVAAQTVPARHVYAVNQGMPGIDRLRAHVAAMPGGERVEIREIATRSWFWDDARKTITAQDPETVIIDLGGDDFLLGDDAIGRVLQEHAAGALATYGQFEPVGGPCDFRASAHTPDEIAAGGYREAPWRATHLKTFRAGLAARIRESDLRTEAGEWRWLTGDQAWMLPILEMAAERAVFVPDPIYGYRMNNPASVHNSPDRLAAQAAEVAHLRSLVPYQRVEWPLRAPITSDGPEPIAVITPLHEPGNRYIEETYGSLRTQTFKAWRWIVLENHGGKVPAKIAADPRVIVSQADDIEGVGALKRAACHMALAARIVELDADDLLAHDALAKVSAAFDRGADFVYSDFAEFQDGTWQARTNDYPYGSRYGWDNYQISADDHDLIAMRSPPVTAHNLRLIDWCPNHVRAWTREAYDSVGGHDPAMHVADDHDLMVRMFLAGKRFTRIPECLYLYRVHGGNTVATRNAAIRAGTEAVYNRTVWALAEKWSRDRRLRLVDLCGGIGAPGGYFALDKRISAGQLGTECDLDGRWPLEDSSVGVLRAHDAIEHLRDPIHTMNEAFRVLAPGGFLMIHSPSSNGLGAFCDPTHVSHWNRLSFRYYTDPAFARYVQAFTGRFQVGRVIEWFPSDWHRSENVPYVEAHLFAVKPGCRPMGDLLW